MGNAPSLSEGDVTSIVVDRSEDDDVSKLTMLSEFTDYPEERNYSFQAMSMRSVPESSPASYTPSTPNRHQRHHQQQHHQHRRHQSGSGSAPGSPSLDKDWQRIQYSMEINKLNNEIVKQNIQSSHRKKTLKLLRAQKASIADQTKQLQESIEQIQGHIEYETPTTLGLQRQVEEHKRDISDMKSSIIRLLHQRNRIREDIQHMHQSRDEAIVEKNKINFDLDHECKQHDDAILNLNDRRHHHHNHNNRAREPRRHMTTRSRRDERSRYSPQHFTRDEESIDDIKRKMIVQNI